MMKQLQKNTGTVVEQWLFCLEHTGVYTMPLCCCLAEQNIAYTLVPAIEIQRSIGLKRGKNDKADAKVIARYAYLHRDSLRLHQMAEVKLQKLKQLLMFRERLMKAKKLFLMEEDDAQFLGKEITREVSKESRLLVRTFDKKIEQADEQIKALVQTDEQMKKCYDLATSVPGVGPQTTCFLIVYTRCFTAFDNARQLACYAGIAPFEYSSGSSVKGRSKVSHLANKKLKSLFSMGALNAKRSDKEIALYYQRKIAEGKNPMLVMNAIRNKLIGRIFATVKRGTPYVPIMKHVA